MVIWITGLAGAGKTMVGKALHKHILNKFDRVIHLDGDELREVFPPHYGYNKSDREELAMQYSKLCKFLYDKNFIVICSTVSMFSGVRKWNRENIPNYLEIYLKVPIDILINRDQKKLYSRAIKGEIKGLIGINEKFDEPKNPDMIIVNDGNKTIDKVAQSIIFKINKRL
jgi:adenylylsulfate kinase-like enzyme